MRFIAFYFTILVHLCSFSQQNESTLLTGKWRYIGAYNENNQLVNNDEKITKNVKSTFITYLENNTYLRERYYKNNNVSYTFGIWDFSEDYNKLKLAINLKKSNYKNYPLSKQKVNGESFSAFFSYDINTLTQKRLILYDSIHKHKLVYYKVSKREKIVAFNGADGPYILKDNLSIEVSPNNEFVTRNLSKRDSIKVKIENTDNDSFYFNLNKDYKSPVAEYEMPDNLVVLSDIEGNYNALYSLLYSNKIIDKNHDWIYGDGHLLVNGDILDRGKNVTQVLWLLYKLDYQAQASGGQVHIIIGNHEVMNFHGDHRYNRGKYIKIAQEVSGLEDKEKALQYLYSTNTELGKWLSSKNVFEKIGDYAFVHGGLSRDLLDYKISIDKINQLVRSHYYEVENIEKDKAVEFLYSTKGPFWYRGMAKKEIKQKQLDKILKFYNASKVVVGHTVVEKIKASYNGKLINTDVKHGKKKFSGKSFALLVENSEEFIIDDLGNKTPLKY